MNFESDIRQNRNKNNWLKDRTDWYKVVLAYANLFGKEVFKSILIIIIKFKIMNMFRLYLKEIYDLFYYYFNIIFLNLKISFKI